VTTDVLDTLLIVVASVAIATLATVYPARQAAKLYPVEAIRHE
jgi:lipoprotein-releasing system permease protein